MKYLHGREGRPAAAVLEVVVVVTDIDRKDAAKCILPAVVDGAASVSDRPSDTVTIVCCCCCCSCCSWCGWGRAPADVAAAAAVIVVVAVDDADDVEDDDGVDEDVVVADWMRLPLQATVASSWVT